jgi:hypothetical protein
LQSPFARTGFFVVLIGGARALARPSGMASKYLETIRRDRDEAG